jgi:hypothetical protein
MMTILRAKVPLMAIAFIAFSGVFNQASALQNCTGKCETGYQACTAWCNTHNKTVASRTTCDIRCGDYWLSGKNPQSIGPADPRNSPPGPAQVNPPPKAQ